MHYLEGFQVMTFFLEIALNLGRKLVLNKPNFMTWFWHANCMTGLKGHRTPLVQTLTNVRRLQKIISRLLYPF